MIKKYEANVYPCSTPATMSTYVMFWPFDPAKNAIQGGHRKEVTHSSGSYERKSRGRKLADEMGRGKKKKSHYTLIDWRTGREWPLNWMTVISARWRTQAIPRLAEVTHPGRLKSEEVAQALRRVYSTAWEFEGNIRPTNWGQLEIGEKEGKQYSGRRR